MENQKSKENQKKIKRKAKENRIKVKLDNLPNLGANLQPQFKETKKRPTRAK